MNSTTRPSNSTTNTSRPPDRQSTEAEALEVRSGWRKVSMEGPGGI
ncbi:hypothetical protein PMI32_04146 [Pseudomonas sp. GM60]|nr:hypothetical protein PMI32_04146 [Pseudomonas sp. GM60]